MTAYASFADMRDAFRSHARCTTHAHRVVAQPFDALAIPFTPQFDYLNMFATKAAKPLAYLDAIAETFRDE